MYSPNHMFELVNEIAIIGVAFLMMAVATVWYSSMLFGVQSSGSEKKSSVFQLAATFVCYFCMLFLLAYASALAPLVSLSPLSVLISLAGFTAALTASKAVLEEKTLRYYLINLGFYVIFIIGGGLVLHYWPW